MRAPDVAAFCSFAARLFGLALMVVGGLALAVSVVFLSWQSLLAGIASFNIGFVMVSVFRPRGY